MQPDKYRWDGDTTDERDSELRAGKPTHARHSGHDDSSLERPARARPQRHARGRLWLALGTVALAALLVYLFAHFPRA
jgi:hypothetical protein